MKGITLTSSLKSYSVAPIKPAFLSYMSEIISYYLHLYSLSFGTMGRSPSPDESNLKKGPWTPEEDQRLVDHISRHGHRNWKTLPRHAGLNRCGKSCRLRWTNYLRPDIKRGRFSDDEDRQIINLHSILGNKWSRIATELPGRTDNEIKNYWNTHLKKKLLRMGVDPTTHMPRTDLSEITHLVQLLGAANIGNLMTSWSNALSLQADASHMARINLLQQLLQAMNASAVLNPKNTGLVGNRSLNPFEGLINGTSALNDLEAFLMNPAAGLIPQAPTNLQGIANSWAGLEGGWNPELLGSKNSSLTSSTIENSTENPLPPLVSAFSGSFTDNIIESKIDPNKFSTSSANSTIFDAWEKLMDDETSDAYWKDMLQSTPSSSSPSPW